jgi:hypothetical protein
MPGSGSGRGKKLRFALVALVDPGCRARDLLTAKTSLPGDSWGWHRVSE